MKTILSFLKPVGKGLDLVRQGLVMVWRVNRVSFFPTEKNLLLSFWYDFVYFKSRMAGATAYSFLDNRVVYIKRILEYPDRPRKTRLLYYNLFNALHHPRLRKVIITFLESSPPEDHYLPVLEAMKRAWRDDGEPSESRHEPSEQPDVPLAGLDAAQPSELSPETREDEQSGDAPGLHAKTYYIAAELYYELGSQPDKFQEICWQMPEMKAFIQRQFKVARLPGTFDKKLKGYSYKRVLTGHDVAKKGQLKPCFRQIAYSPQVFGEAIAGRAREILVEYFN